MSLEPKIHTKPSAPSSDEISGKPPENHQLHPREVRYLSRPAFQLLLATLLGVLLFLADIPIWGGIVLAVAGAMLLFFQKRTTALLLLWSLLFAWYAHLRNEPRSNLPEGKTLYDTKIHLLYPTASSLEGAIFYHSRVEVDGQSFKVRLQIPPHITLPESLQYGSEAVATLDISSLKTLKNKSFRHYLLSEGYEAQGAIHNISKIQKPNILHPVSLFQSIRADIVRHFEALTKEHLSLEERGLIYALALGDRTLLPTSVRHAFTASGVAHILAVSGYHLGVVYGVLMVLLSLSLRPYRFRYLRYTLLLIALLGYTLITGASTATVRAFVMSTLFTISRFQGRPADAIQVLSLTFVIFLLIEPYSIFSVGLMLSLAAVWGIFLFLPLFQNYFYSFKRSLTYFSEIIFVTLSAQLGVFPLLFYYFGSASLSFLWSNLPLVLLSGLLIPYALGLMLWGWLFGWLPSPLIRVAQILSQWMIELSNFFAQWTQAGLQVTQQYDLVLLVLSYAALILGYKLVVRRIRLRLF